MGRVVAVIGASSDRRKFGNKAVRAFGRHGYTVVPVNPRETAIEGVRAWRSVIDYPDSIDLASFYVPPSVGLVAIEEVSAKQIAEVWLNPGAESPALVERARSLGVRVVVTCSLIRLGESPAAF